MSVLPDWGAASPFDGEDAAGMLDLPLTLTKRGCAVYATKAR